MVRDKLVLDCDANVDIGNQIEVCIIDYGFSSKVDSIKEYLVCGTLKYTAPEVLKRKGYSGVQFDIWSLGIIMFKALFKKFPFEDKNRQNLEKMILENQICIGELKSHINTIKSESETFMVNQTIRNEFIPLITKILNKNPIRRPSISQVIYYSLFNFLVYQILFLINRYLKKFKL